MLTDILSPRYLPSRWGRHGFAWTAALALHGLAVADEAGNCERARLRMLENDHAGAYQLLSAAGIATALNGCLFNFGIAALSTGRPEIAAEALQKFLRRVPGDPEAAFYFAEALERKCNTVPADEREECLNRPETKLLLIIALQNERAAAAVSRSARGGFFARLVHMFASPEAAIPLYAQYTQAHPGDVRGLVNYGGALYDARYPTRALAVLTEAGRRDPALADDSYYFHRLVSTLKVLKRHRALLDFYGSNPARFARWPWALSTIATAYLGVGDVGCAATVLDTQLRLLETDRSAAHAISYSYSLRGDLALLQKDRTIARLAYERAIAAADHAGAVAHARRSLSRLASRAVVVPASP